MTAAPDPDRAVGPPPDGLSARPATLRDAQGVADVYNAASREFRGKNEISASELRGDWTVPGFDPETDSRVLVDRDGGLVAYGDIWGGSRTFVRFGSWVRVWPDRRGRGLGTWLNRWAEARARADVHRAPPDARVVLETMAPVGDTCADRLMEELGRTACGTSWEMAIDLEEAPTAPVWPEGVTVETLRPGEERDAYRVVRESFRDHRGHVEEPFEQAFARWWHLHEHDEHHDPSLWFLARTGDDIVGVAINAAATSTDPDFGWCETLGVVRAHRQRGLGRALLAHTFRELHARGRRRAGLSVDAESLTGAHRLYESAGMRVVHAHTKFELEVREGREMRRMGPGGG